MGELNNRPGNLWPVSPVLMIDVWPLHVTFLEGDSVNFDKIKSIPKLRYGP